MFEIWCDHIYFLASLKKNLKFSLLNSTSTENYNKVFFLSINKIFMDFLSKTKLSGTYLKYTPLEKYLANVTRLVNYSYWLFIDASHVLCFIDGLTLTFKKKWHFSPSQKTHGIDIVSDKNMTFLNPIIKINWDNLVPEPHFVIEPYGSSWRVTLNH